MYRAEGCARPDRDVARADGDSRNDQVKSLDRSVGVAGEAKGQSYDLTPGCSVIGHSSLMAKIVIQFFERHIPIFGLFVPAHNRSLAHFLANPSPFVPRRVARLFLY